MDIRTNLAEFRARRGLGAAQLAAEIGVSRQTVYAIEAGTYVPNTAVSLKLARALETTVEELFQIEEKDQEVTDEIAEATLLGDTKAVVPGQLLQLCNVNNHLMAVAPEPSNWGLPPADGALLELAHNSKRNTNAKVKIFTDKWKEPARVLVAGCDPSASILSRSLQRADCDLIIAFENSSRSLELLHEGKVHIAGTHLVDKVTGKTDLTSITKLFPRNSVAVFSYAIWEEGLITALGNPKHIINIEDLARKDVRITNREAGAGCRRLLDDMLHKAGIPTSQVKGYDRITVGHLPAARLVRSGEVDCCINTHTVARAMGLDFIPLAQKPYHLVLRRAQLSLPPIQTLLETLGHTVFRREVEACTGYNMRTAGDRLI
jgi:putative molybdopterin biosynthesis protein